MSLIDELAGMVDDVAAEVLGDPITRYKRGDSANTEVITGAIVERDNSAASGVAESGLIADDRGIKTVRLARVELPASYATHPKDKYLINGEVWDVVGAPVGDDGQRKSVLLKLNEGLTGLSPRTQR